ncbi:MAG TPA: hypothetical protein VF557_11625 [Jatrophihabitans sp.]|jgi:hypothetical protein|uniref:hypothetical protein n=1 Tax=Jatrophihabitans sp. TaxID=1932789 RepID=UPI002EE30D5B
MSALDMQGADWAVGNLSAPAVRRVFLIQCVVDPRRHEPRNVGVIITDGHHVEIKTLNPSVTRGREHAALKHVDDTYQQWREFWLSTIASYEADESIDLLLSRQRPSYPIFTAAEFIGESHQSVAELAETYFEQLVLPPEADEALQDRPVERALRAAGILDSTHLRRRFKVKAVGEPDVELTFPYAWQNGHVAVAQTILRGAGDDVVSGSLWKFDHVPAQFEKVAIVDHYISNRPASLVKLLQKTATVVDLDDMHAGEKLKAAFKA